MPMKWLLRQNTIPILFNFLIMVTFSSVIVTYANSSVTPSIQNSHNDPVIRVAGDAYLPPFSFVSSEGEFGGFSIDLFKAVSEVTGLSFEYIPMELYQAEEALKTGRVDVVIGLKYTAEREINYDFSDSYFTMSEGIVVPIEEDQIKFLSDLKEKTVAIQNEHVAFDLLQNVRRVQMNIAQNQEDALKLLMLGRADAFVGNKWTAAYYLKKWEIEKKYRLIENPIQPAEYAVAVGKGNEDLLKKINLGLLTIKANGKYDQLYYDWFSYRSTLMSRLKYAIFGMIVVISLIISFSIIWNHRLKKEVLKHTKALQDANVHLEKSKLEIANREAFKNQVINSTPSGIVTFDLNWNVSSINKEASRYDTDTHTKSIPSLIRQILHTTMDEYDCKNSKSGEVDIYENDCEYLFYYNLRPIYDSDQDSIGYLLTFENRTEERRLQQKLAIQEKMHALGQLSAGVAHEMRNPLTSIKAFIELLPEKYDNPSFRAAIKQHVPEEINRLNQIIEDLLDYSRPKAPKKEVFDVGNWLESVLALFQPIFKEDGIELVVKVESNTLMYADPQQIKQVLVNLILNSIDAMKEVEDRKLSIKCYSDKNKSMLRLVDTGMGMKQLDIERIYEPFYTTKKNGVGLGMTVCFQLIKENKGEIQIKSELGKGTGFEIILPHSTSREE
jgi:ABC-type amino acid transport substrate-binding protein/signal transduction histidine kinase